MTKRLKNQERKNRMELKPYQQQVINDLSLFLEQVQETRDVKEAFYNFLAKHPKTPLFPFTGTAIEPDIQKPTLQHCV